MKKRLLSILLAVLMLFSLLPLTATAAEIVNSGTCGENVKWTLDSDGLLTISGAGAMTDYDWGTSPFCDNSSIKTIVIEDGVTSIGDCAFVYCTGLTSVTIPDSVTSIGAWAFDSCDSLTSVTIPNSVTSIGDCAFYYCTGLTSVTIPSSVTSIGDSAFSYCDGLTSVTIPDSVTSIGECAFCGSDSLTGIWVDENNANYSSDTFGVLFNKKKTELLQCPGGYTGKYIIPDSVTSIGDSAFEGCMRLTSVTIPNSVTSIGAWAFAYCDGLASVIIPDSVTSIGAWAFAYCDGLASVTIPDSVTSISHMAFCSCDSLTGIWVDENNANYSSDTFGVLFNKKKTELLQCPGGYNGKYIIPDSVTSIRNWAFESCTGLTSVTIPDSVTVIDEEAFAWCDGLTSVTIPDSVTWIGYQAFYNCDGLTSVYFYGDAPELGDGAFQTYDRDTWYVNIPGLTLYYIEGKAGWTSQTWNGYPTATWDPSLPQYQYNDIPENAWYVDAINYAVANGLMNGVAEDTFRPEGTMTRAMLVTVLWRYAGEPVEGTNTFSDVKDDLWYTDAVAWASANGIVTGVGNGRFNPEGSISREQLATILYRYANRQGIDTSSKAELNSFPDAGSVSGWALDAMQWCVAEGIIGGSNGKLLPQGNATRAQVAAILMRFIENVVNG